MKPEKRKFGGIQLKMKTSKAIKILEKHRKYVRKKDNGFMKPIFTLTKVLQNTTNEIHLRLANHIVQSNTSFISF